MPAVMTNVACFPVAECLAKRLKAYEGIEGAERPHQHLSQYSQ